MNIKNIADLLNSGISLSTLHIKQRRLVSFIDKGFLHSSEQKDNNAIGLFGAILFLIFDELIRFGYSPKIISKIYQDYYKDSLTVSKFELSDSCTVYNFPLALPVLLTLMGEKHYLIISGEGELFFENEKDLVARISFSDATGDSVHGRILIDIEIFLSRLGLKPEHHSKGTLKKLGKILAKNKIPFLKGGKYFYETQYYHKPSLLGDTIGNVARVPNRTTILKSNDKGSITHISTSTRVELQ